MAETTKTKKKKAESGNDRISHRAAMRRELAKLAQDRRDRRFAYKSVGDDTNTTPRAIMGDGTPVDEVPDEVIEGIRRDLED